MAMSNLNTLLNINIEYQGTTYTAKVGSVVDEYLSDAIDSIVIDIKQFSGIEFIPFKLIKIDSVNYVIGNVNPTNLVYNTDGTARIVNYELACYNPAIILQRTITSAFSVSQPIDTSATKTTLYQEIYRLRYKTDGSNYNFLMSDELIAATSSVTCADITLDRSNLYDAINALLSQINYIATATISDDEVITVGLKVKYDNDQENSTLNGLTAYTESYSGADYATALNLKISQGINVDNNHITKSEFGLTLRSQDNFAITNDNAELVLQNNIYGITHLYLLIPRIKFEISYHDENSVTQSETITVSNIKLDIAEKHLLEKKAFDVKDPIESSWNVGDSIDEDNQNYYIYYEMGKNTINGFGNTWNYFLGFDGMVFTAIIRDMVEELGETLYEDYMYSPTIVNTYYQSLYDNDSSTINDEYTTIINFTTDYKNWAFSIEYQPEPTYKLQFGKTIQDSYEHEISLFDKQNEAYVNVEKYGDSEQIKTDRTGNKVKQVSTKVKTTDYLMELGEKNNDFVLIHRQYSIFPNFVKSFNEYYEKYTVNNLFNGIAQKKRIYQISTDYFDREILVKYKIRFSTDANEGYEALPTDRMIRSIYGAFINSNDNQDAIGALYLDCRNENNDNLVYYNTNRGYAWMQFTQAVVGNSVALHCNCLTNSYVGLRKENTSSYENGGTGQSKVSYVDGLGRVYKFCFECKHKYELATYESANYGHIDYFNKLPFWTNFEVQLIPYQIIYKSENERLGFTLQFECCVSSDITPIDIPHIADRIIIQPEEIIPTSGIIVVGNGYGIPTITIESNGKIKIVTTINANSLTGKHTLIFDGISVLSWGSEKTIYVYIQR